MAGENSDGLRPDAEGGVVPTPEPTADRGVAPEGTAQLP
jgi:hypothetical protein